MPAPRLIQPKNALYKMRMEVVHYVYELHPTVGLKVEVEFTDGDRYTIANIERGLDDLDAFARLPQDLMDAFLWGDGARAVVSTVASFDYSAQSRRVRKGLPEG